LINLSPQVQTEISSMLKVHEEGAHPHVMRIHELVEQAHFLQAPVICLVLEYAPHGELFEYLAMTQMFSENVARVYAAQMFNALAHCHAVRS
jgi:serine/threonine protein kinase